LLSPENIDIVIHTPIHANGGLKVTIETSQGKAAITGFFLCHFLYFKQNINIILIFLVIFDSLEKTGRVFSVGVRAKITSQNWRPDFG
jgi:hypothetical protein